MVCAKKAVHCEAVAYILKSTRRSFESEEIIRSRDATTAGNTKSHAPQDIYVLLFLCLLKLYLSLLSYIFSVNFVAILFTLVVVAQWESVSG